MHIHNWLLPQMAIWSNLLHQNFSPSDDGVSKHHILNLNNILILDSEPSYYYKRINFEMIHIKKQKLGLNKQSDWSIIGIILVSIKRIISYFHLIPLILLFLIFLTNINTKEQNTEKHKNSVNKY